jgi:CubicO group peptidase (beta-lactamase class C family)
MTTAFAKKWHFSGIPGAGKHSFGPTTAVIFWLFASFCQPPPPDYVPKKVVRGDPLEIEKAKRDLEALADYGSWKRLYYGMTLGVVQGDRLIYDHRSGYTEGRKYALGSITKIFTATAVMRMIEQKQIGLDSPVRSYLPELELEDSRLGSSPITIKHLLSHSSGLPDLRYLHPALRTIHAFAYPVPPQIVPAGLHYRYSNAGFMILGDLISRVSGQKLSELAQRLIFDPLEMNQTEAAHLVGASGINTNIEDLSHFAIMYLNHGTYRGRKILDPASIDAMLSPPIYYPPAESQEYCGLGWRVKRGPDGVVTFFHIGAADYIAGWLQIFPGQDVAVFYLGNPPKYDDAKPTLLGLQVKLAILAAAYAGTKNALYLFKPTQPGRDIMEGYQGTYRNLLNGMKAEVFLKNDSLYFKRDGTYAYQIVPQTNHVFVGGYESLTHDFIHERGTNRILGVATYEGFYKREEVQSTPKQ